MVTVYFDSQIFRYLKNLEIYHVSKQPLIRRLSKYISENRKHFLYFFSHAHLLDLENDKTDKKFDDLKFMESIVENNFLIQHFGAEKAKYLLVDPSTAFEEYKLNKVLDFACGSGSLLLNVRTQLKKETKGTGTIGKIYGQEKNITTYNLARMNMLLHGMKDTEFEIFHGDTLLNQWDEFNEMNPSKKIKFDAIVANPPFSLRWEPNDTLAEDFRFKGYGLAPKSAADFAFLLHGFHFLGTDNLSDDGTMAIILPHGVLFRGGAEARIREKLLKDNRIDAIIGLPSNLFYSTGIPVCILVLKKCKKQDDVLFINASEQFEKGKRQNTLSEKHLDNIVETYKFRNERERYSRRVSMDEIKKNDFNLNISRYVSTSEDEVQIDLKEVSKRLTLINESIKENTDRHNEFLKELNLDRI